MIDVAIGFEREVDSLSVRDGVNLFANHPTLNFIKVKHDASLPSGCEIIFPPLSSKAESTWEYSSQVNDLIIANGGRITRQCGHHVHFGVKPITMDSEDFNRQSIQLFKDRDQYFQDSNDMFQFEVIKDVVYRYAQYQDFISSFLAPSRRNSRYASPIDGFLNRIEDSQNYNDLKNVIQGKFFAINLRNIDVRNQRGTIEFRQHQGTVNNTKLKNWIMFLVNMFDYTINHRIQVLNQGVKYMDTLTNTMPRNTKLYQVFDMIQSENGATTREIMETVGINDARSVRRTINTIRRKLGDCSLVICLNQEYYGHLNGTSNGAYDLNGYKIPLEVEKESQGEIVINNNADSHPFTNLAESLKTWFNNRISRLGN